MDFDLDDQQRELRDTARRFLEREAPISYARAMMDDEQGYRDDIWQRMAEMGWMALPFPASHDGLEMGFVPLALLLAEMGRVVLPGPYFSSVVLGGSAVAEAGSDEQRARLLPRIASGEAIVTLAVDGTARLRNGTIAGSARMVPDGHVAEAVVVVARDQDDTEVLVLAEPSDRRAVMAMDQTRKVADLSFDDVPAEPLPGGQTALRRVLDRAAVGLAAEMLGLCERALELSVDYAKERVQFGRPIGSFQAIKHRAADMFVDVESLRNAVYFAAWAIERDHPDASLAASMAKAYASDAARRVTSSGIQIHGGIGFTWEHDMHLYFKRAKADEVAFGDAVHHRERIAALLRARVPASQPS